MPREHLQCDPGNIERLLDGRLTPEEQTRFESHLENCTTCRSHLEEIAAETSYWTDAAVHLRDDDLDEEPAVRGQIGPAATDGPDSGFRADTLRIADYFDPTDDPRMLGRFGGYEIVGIIGYGGMGVVLKGYEAALDRYVAIKLLAPHLATSGAARTRFAREARAAAAVLHENVVAIHRVSESKGIPYLVMPYMPGESLQKRLDEQGPMQLNEILRIGMQVAAGLAAAHAQGLVHRDIKPGNILLGTGVERVTITDFGLARAVDDASLTRSGVIAGTPQYMSPEQSRGEAVDHRSDLFSMGTLLYAMCTGRAPFRAETSYGVLRRITDEEPRPIREINPDIPEWLCWIIGKLMSKRCDDRFDAAREVAKLLEGCLSHVQQPTSVALPAAIPAPAARLASKQRRIHRKGIFIMLAVLGSALLGMFVMQATDPPDIAGRWSGDGWGQIVLSSTAVGEYNGTYSETISKQSGKIELKWSRIERRFNGRWSEGQDRFGELSLRLVDHEIRGALTTDPQSKINPATPRLADLSWTRAPGVDGQAPASVADALQEYRRTLVGYDLGFRSVFPQQKWTGYDAARLKMYPSKDAWPQVLGHVDTDPNAFKTVRNESEYPNRPIAGPYAFWVALDTGLAADSAYTTMLFLKGIRPRGTVVAKTYASLMCFGPMEGALNFESYATALVKGNLSGRITAESYFDLVVEGKFTGQILANSYAMIYLVGGCEGSVELKNGAKVYIGGRTKQTDLSRIKGQGKVFLEESDLPPGEHRIGDIGVTVGEYKTAFGPVIERVVGSARSGLTDCLIDLDTGKLLSLPESMAFARSDQAASEEMRTWVREHHVDAIGLVHSESEGVPYGPVSSVKTLYCELQSEKFLGLFAEKVEDDAWEKLTETELAKTIDRAILDNFPTATLMRTSANDNGTPMQPVTYIFETREGGKGILQILGPAGPSDMPTGIKIRFKLIQGTANFAVVPQNAEKPSDVLAEKSEAEKKSDKQATDDAPEQDKVATSGTTSLDDAIRGFNLRAKFDPTGKKQPPLNEEEVIAAIRSSLIKWSAQENKNLLPVSDKILNALQKTIDNRTLPPEFKFETITHFVPNDQYEFTKWSVRLRIPAASEGYTTCVVIRDTTISSRPLSEEERKSLQSGVRHYSHGAWDEDSSPQIEQSLLGPKAGLARPATEAEQAISRLVLVFFRDGTRRAVPAVKVNGGTHTLIMTTAPATVIPGGAKPAIDRTFLEIPGRPGVRAEYIPGSTKELSVYRAEGGLTNYRPDKSVTLMVGDALSAVIPGSSPEIFITPNAARVAALDREANLDLPKPLTKTLHFDQLIEVDRSLPEGTPLFKDGKLAGLTLLGKRFLGETSNHSYVVPVERIAALCSQLEAKGDAVPTADGSTAKSDQSGKAAEKQEELATAAVNPAAELKALQGPWKVVKVEKGKDADANWASIGGWGSPWDPAWMSYFDFTTEPPWGIPLELMGRTEEWLKVKTDLRNFFWQPGTQEHSSHFSYRIDPTAEPNTLDLMRREGATEATVALAIYALKEDRLKICVAKYRPSIASDQRPKSFTIRDGSADILFVLERYLPSADEKALQGSWKVVTQIEDGKPVAAEVLRTRIYAFNDQFALLDNSVSTAGPWSLFSLDETKKPGSILVTGFECDQDGGYIKDEKGSLKEQKLSGIYRFDGDRLTIAFRKGGPAPEKFESTSGSGVTLLVLKRGESKPTTDSIPTSKDEATSGSENKPDEIEATLFKTYRANRDKLKCGILSWTRTTMNDGFTHKGRKYETVGTYKLWWDGDKIATTYLGDRVVVGPDGENFSIEAHSGGSSYDGGAFSAKPKRNFSENWLDYITRWNSREKLIPTQKEFPHVKIEWSLDNSAGEKQLKLLTTNKQDGAYGVQYFDLSRGGQPLSEESYTAQKELYARRTYKLQEVSGGVWFPIEVVEQSIEHGKVTLHQHYQLDLERCRFNDRAAIPAGIFSQSAGEIEHKYQDEIKKSYEKAKKATQQVEARKQPQSPTAGNEAEVRSLMQGFEEAINREDQAAIARLLVKRMNKGSAANIMREMKESIKLGATPAIIRLANVHGDRALVATEFFEFADSRYKGKQCLVYRLDRDNDEWLIRDIDMENVETLAEEIRRFDTGK